MLPRILEPEAMDTDEEVRSYDAMDHSEVNRIFARDFLAAHGPMRGGEALDIGTGTARIPVEICRVDSGSRVAALDLAEKMLVRAREVIAEAGFSDRIRTVLADAKGITLPSDSFEAVISNTIIHHVPEPITVLAEAARLVAPGGTIFIRDLARPADRETLERLVETYAGNESADARRLFADSLHAALTVDEVRDLLRELGLPEGDVSMTSDRHWTWIRKRPESE